MKNGGEKGESKYRPILWGTPKFNSRVSLDSGVPGGERLKFQ